MILTPFADRDLLVDAPDSRRPRQWFVTSIPACGPAPAGWSDPCEHESADHQTARIGGRLESGHPQLPLVLPDPRGQGPDVPAVMAPPGRPDPGPSDPGDSAEPLLPDAGEWSHWLARMLIEVSYGRRPIGQLSRWAEERVLATVVLRTRQLKLAAQPGGRAGASLGSVRVQRPSTAAVEAMATVRADRPAAIAFRLEARGERWLCTAVDFGPQTPQPA